MNVVYGYVTEGAVRHSINNPRYYLEMNQTIKSSFLQLQSRRDVSVLLGTASATCGVYGDGPIAWLHPLCIGMKKEMRQSID